MAAIAPDRLRRARLLAGFGDGELAEIAALTTEVELPAGFELIRQGGPAEGAWLLEEGALSVVRKLPGGGETPLAEFGPGALVGEISLLRDEPPTATVHAKSACRALRLDRRLFRGGRERLEPATLALTRAILAELARRVHALEARAASAAAEGAPGEPPLQPAMTRRSPDWNWRGFLPLLPCFRHYERADLDSLAAAFEAEETPAGAVLLAQGSAANSLLVVGRGAVESAWWAGGRPRQVGVLGPGEIVAAASLVGGGASALSHATREDSTLLRLDAGAFRRLQGERSRAGLATLDAVAESLVRAQRRAGSLVARVLGLTRAGGLAGQSRSG